MPGDRSHLFFSMMKVMAVFKVRMAYFPKCCCVTVYMQSNRIPPGQEINEHSLYYF